MLGEQTIKKGEFELNRIEKILLPTLGALVSIAGAPVLAAEGGKRQLEEVVVTAERRESTVSDTAISITALDG
jgi:outer membrane cobalamin receptor